LNVLLQGLREGNWREKLRFLQGWWAFTGLFSQLPEGSIAYERGWSGVRGKPPADEVWRFVTRAVNAAPKAYGAGFALALFVGEAALLKRWTFHLSDLPRIERELREFLAGLSLAGEDLWVNLIPGAVFAGATLRPLIKDVGEQRF